MKKKLNSKERIFVDEYLLHLNPERAAIAAGYSRSMARTKAYQWVSDGKRKPHVFSAVKAALDRRAKRIEIKQDSVLKELARVAFFDPRRLFDRDGNLIPLCDLPKDIAAAIVGLHTSEAPGNGGKTKSRITNIRFADKLKALDSLARHLGMYNDKVKHSFDEEALRAVLSALPPEYAQSVVQALARARGEG